MMGYSYLFMAILNAAIIVFAGRITGFYQVSEETKALAVQVMIFSSVLCGTFMANGIFSSECAAGGDGCNLYDGGIDFFDVGLSDRMQLSFYACFPDGPNRDMGGDGS